MKKSVAIVLIVVSVVICSCPSLAYGVGSLVMKWSPAELAGLAANAQSTTGTEMTPEIIALVGTIFKVLSGCIILLGLAIPLVVGLITLRMARKHQAAQTPPLQ
jgi:hypothetical protein